MRKGQKIRCQSVAHGIFAATNFVLEVRLEGDDVYLDFTAESGVSPLPSFKLDSDTAVNDLAGDLVNASNGEL